MTGGRGRRGQRVPRAAGLVLGYALDALLADPRRYHPVAGFGTIAARLERLTYADRRTAGVIQLGVLAGGVASAGVLAERATRDRPVARTVVTAAATWAVLGGTSLVREAAAIEARLRAGDLPGARTRITALVSRDPAAMDEAAVVRACVESVAENTSDAVTGPLVWGALAGVPGLCVYRAVNTLDAMIGYRTERYARFGWAAARCDDLLNLVPARLTAALVIALSPVTGGSPARTWHTVRRDAPAHPSPNGGVVEAAFAGALRIRLGGVNVYDGAAQDRGTLGDGAPAGVDDIARAGRLSRATGLAAALLAAFLSGLLSGLRSGLLPELDAQATVRGGACSAAAKPWPARPRRRAEVSTVAALVAVQANPAARTRSARSTSSWARIARKPPTAR